MRVVEAMRKGGVCSDEDVVEAVRIGGGGSEGLDENISCKSL